MEGLYKEVADTESGFVKGKTLYDAQIIRSYFEKGTVVTIFLMFQVESNDNERSDFYS